MDLPSRVLQLLMVVQLCCRFLLAYPKLPGSPSSRLYVDLFAVCKNTILPTASVPLCPSSLPKSPKSSESYIFLEFGGGVP
jgi:hypothetical protein